MIAYLSRAGLALGHGAPSRPAQPGRWPALVILFAVYAFIAAGLEAAGPFSGA